MQQVSIITPCYNEGNIVITFLKNLERSLSSLPFHFNVIVVDDCSTDDTLSLVAQFQFSSPDLSLHTVSLPHNAGHQVAIYEGLVFAATLPCERFIIMDSDGEDAPEVIPGLLAQADADIVHVVRSKRRESWLFVLAYYCYRLLFWLATGKQMNYGNFCLIKREVAEMAVRNKFAHFAAFLAKQKYETHYIVADKQQRLGGKSKMGYKKHIGHALRSFEEYGLETSRLKRVLSR